ncbi:SIMPL domain-containing protein [Iodobacter sp.]|uniref:SIMPL domain-containing protein n=1 Tax=Iodobacter sp. TaxID=1915058 RepID=UPI0025FA7619|nr:SIMPL domain-containing protein [Iodobacter sp.]
MKNLLSAFILTSLATTAAAAEAPMFNVVNLEASATREVANDLASAVLFVELSDTDPARLSDKINQTLAAAVKQVKQKSEVQNRGTSFATYPLYGKTNKQEGWRSRGELRISSSDFAVLSKLLAQLQQPVAGGLPVQLANVGYSVSDGARAKAEEALIEEGVQAFKQRANLIQKGFSAKSWKMINVNVNSAGGYRPQPVMMMKSSMMESADVANAPIESGESRLTVNVSGSIQVSE